MAYILFTQNVYSSFSVRKKLLKTQSRIWFTLLPSVCMVAAAAGRGTERNQTLQETAETEREML